VSECRRAFVADTRSALAAAILALAAACADDAYAQAPSVARQLELRPAPKSAAAGVSSPADPVARWRSYVVEASRRFGVPAAWIERVIRAESGGHMRFNGRPITSRAGAMGLMQLMPATWSALRADLGLGADPYDPRDNILAGTAYLAALYRRFGYPGLFGAYNAGPARYAAWLTGRRALPAETRVYLARVAGENRPAALFAGRSSASSQASSSAVASTAAAVIRPFPRGQLFAVDRATDRGVDHRPGGREGLFVPLSGAASPASEH
jgi:soluble lytic murein transglycosylase-like protein